MSFTPQWRQVWNDDEHITVDTGLYYHQAVELNKHGLTNLKIKYDPIVLKSTSFSSSPTNTFPFTLSHVPNPKTFLGNDENVARENKVTDLDLNEIKEVVNSHANDIENFKNQDDTEVKQHIIIIKQEHEAILIILFAFCLMFQRSNLVRHHF